MSTSPSIQERIQQIIDNERIVLFMKGDAQMPQCGFSARAVSILQSLNLPFDTVNVLSDPEIRQGIKDFSQWPTIPQLYIEKEFVGGSDIVTQMFESGELHKMLGVAFEVPKPPEFTVSDSFVKAIQAALAEADGDLSAFPRIQISPRFEYGIGLSQRSPGDLEVEVGGLVFLIDSASAPRAEGMHVNFLEGPDGGVVVDNPNAPAQVQRMDASSLKALMDADKAHRLIDIRTQEEWNTARIEGAVLMDTAGQQQMGTWSPDDLIVVMCHRGVRSAQAAQQLMGMGFTNVHNLVGGIEAWSTQVDTNVPRY